MSEIQNISKFLDPSKLSKGRQIPYVREGNAQISVPTLEQAKQLGEGQGFKNILGGYLDEVNTLQHDAEAQIQRLAAGETEDIHEVMIAMDEAETAFEMMMEIRNKLVESYREIMRTQV